MSVFEGVSPVVDSLTRHMVKLLDAVVVEDVIETRIHVCRIEAKCKEIRAELLEIEVPEDISEED